MFHKTAAALGLVAVSGAAAGTAGSYPAYPVNNTAPSSVWQYYNTTVPTTVVVPQFTTVCPEATTLSYNGVQYTVTKGETVTVTNCPCTISTAVHTLTSSLCPPGVTPTAVVPAVPTGIPHPAETPAPGTPGVPAPPGNPGAPAAGTPGVPAPPGNPGAPGTPAVGTPAVPAAGTPAVPSPAGTTPAPGAPAEGGSPPAGAAPAVGTSGAAPVANTPNPPAGTTGYAPSAVPSGIAVSGAGSNSGFAAALFAAFLGVVAL
ncbi:uncharacterized protein F4817DRAFT_236899 [Daldinia loculata]|uniref:uncharacterized protein n=1 Tax=Daldinia loculata TaxID=103429 RepID=UPI0020C517FC|nr:uncharacterized protein F4817DRAFT_236899 [Daldinia loculata]KAI1650603.1 hypothetical protein F4817DRAFT_236899 [Daldinia loculata]